MGYGTCRLFTLAQHQEPIPMVNRTHPVHSCSLNLERLEAREVPAGIVSVFASNASFLNTVNLVITGDDLDNQIDIVRQAGQVKIIARGDTLLHYDLDSTYNYGTVTPTYTEITFDASRGMRDVTIQMFSGNDDVRISVIGNHRFGNLLVSLGEGNNSFLLMGSSSTSASNKNYVTFFSLDGGAGRDQIYVYKTFISGGTLNTGGGHDSVYLNDIKGNSLSITLGAGNDTLLVHQLGLTSFSVDLGSGDDQATFTGNNTFGSFNSLYNTWVGGLTVLEGAGRDTLSFAGTTVVDNKLSIDLGAEPDRLFVAAAANTTDPPTLKVDGPDGQINTTILTGTGNDVVRFGTGSGSGKSVQFEVETRLNLGSGDDALYVRNAIFNLIIALLGDGNDKVLNNWGSSNVTVGSGSKLHGGPGIDVLPASWTTPTNLTVLAIP